VGHESKAERRRATPVKRSPDLSGLAAHWGIASNDDPTYGGNAQIPDIPLGLGERVKSTLCCP
jgi:hypothetical protein